MSSYPNYSVASKIRSPVIKTVGLTMNFSSVFICLIICLSPYEKEVTIKDGDSASGRTCKQQTIGLTAGCPCFFASHLTVRI